MGIFWFLYFVMIHSLILVAGNTYYRCYSTGNFSSDSQYIQSRNSLLSALADGVKDQGGFYSTTAIVYPPTPVPDCLGLCRKDLISSDDCYNCISKSASDLSQNSPVQKQIVAWGADADCMVQCIPPATLKPQRDDTHPSEHACNATGVSAINLSRFGGTLANVTAKLALKVASEGTSSSFPSGYNEPQYFATEEAKFGDLQTIYAGGYCLPSLSASDFTACLKDAANQSDKYCNGKNGASIFTPGCVLRFELYPFYKSTKSVAPSPSVSPSSNTRKKSRAKNRIAVFTIILPIISVVTLLVLIIGTMMILKRRKQHWDHKAQAYNNITLDSFLKAGDPSSSWVSPSKDFAFGFQEIQPGNFLLAIWFNQIPEKTITWYANRDHLVLSGSKVELTTDKGFTLTNSDGLEIWRAKLVGNGSSDGERLSYAAILDTGNFILATQASAILWQSFDEPTDTLLPTQVLNLGGQLISRFTEKNYSGGRFTFTLKRNGNAALYTTNFPLFNNLNEYYWLYQEVGHQVVFNQSGVLYLAARNGSIVTDMFSNELSEKQVIYQRVILEFDGVLRHYVYKKSSSLTGGGWSIKFFAPDNICTAVIQQTGSGVCGYNSYCKLGNDSKPRCICPPGYTVLDPEDEMSGCFQSFLPQSCDKTTPENNQFDFKVLKDVDWPLSDYEHSQNVSIDWCREVCLADCFCAVGIFRENGDCWKKKLPLSNGKNDRSVDRTAFIKVRISSGFNERRCNRVKKVLTALLATSGLANIVLLGIVVLEFYFFAHRKNPKVRGNYSVRSFRYKELNEATNGFNEELGRGAFGVVYKGFISDQLGTQTPIAVKKLDALSQNADKEFKAEVNSIGHTHHKNLVKLVGFCEEEEHRMLVYEFMSNGTLSDFLYQPPKPTWEKRLRIAQGIARGLFYLHEDCSTQVIHCDIKPQNILLDDDHNARKSDFGLAKLLRLDQTQTNTTPRGTRGYVAPEWFKNMPITAKVDVYSFGILLLEIICCQRNVQGENNEEEGVVLLTDWAFDCYQMETIGELVKDDTEALNDKKRLERMVKIVSR